MKFISGVFSLALLIAVIVFAVMATGWFNANPGTVTFDWLGATFTTSVTRLVLLLLAGLFLFFLLIQASLWLVTAPKRLRQRRALNRYEKATGAITDAMLALEAKQPSRLKKQVQKLEKLLPNQAITLWTKGRLQEQEQDDAAAKQSYNQLRHHKRAKGSALSNLQRLYKAEGNHMEAMYTAEKLFAHDSSAENLAELLAAYKRTGRVKEAQKALDQFGALHPFSGKSLGALSLTQERALCLLLEAKQQFARRDYHAAYKQAVQAYKLDPQLIPAAEIAAECAIANGKNNAAMQVIEGLWAHVPYRPLLLRYLEIMKEKEPQKRLKRVQKWVAKNGSYEGHVALAEIALDAEQFDTARSHMASALRLRLTKRACSVMAQIESRDSAGDPSLAAKWIAKEELADDDAHWLCSSCGTATDGWHLHCPACDSQETILWGPVPGNSTASETRAANAPKALASSTDTTPVLLQNE